MASLDFEIEKRNFRDFYAEKINQLEIAMKSYSALINALLTHNDDISISKIEGRVKDKEESIRKFNLKYRDSLEAAETPYSIKNHISDLIGLRIVCLYEDDVEKIQKILEKHFDIIDVTNKIIQIESTEDSFGYKGLHLDLKLSKSRIDMPEYQVFKEFSLEIQIRTIIQDSWSVLDHKIKYKKSIPNSLKRRINTLAALFELADREFKEIRLSTEEEIKKATNEEMEHAKEENSSEHAKNSTNSNGHGLLNAFEFLKIANHFFKDFDFQDFEVDNFTQEIVSKQTNITKRMFNKYLVESISKVKQYKLQIDSKKSAEEGLNPYNVIRHCLYYNNKKIYSKMLGKASKASFEKWLNENN